jgi:hypothetical protein
MKYFTVKLSSNLFVGKLGLTLKTCDGKTSGTVPDDDAIFRYLKENSVF